MWFSDDEQTLLNEKPERQDKLTGQLAHDLAVGRKPAADF